MVIRYRSPIDYHLFFHSARAFLLSTIPGVIAVFAKSIAIFSLRYFRPTYVSMHVFSVYTVNYRNSRKRISNPDGFYDAIHRFRHVWREYKNHSAVV